METNDIILSTVRKVEDQIASIDRDLEKDRQNLQNLTIEVKTLASQMEEVRRAINLNAERVRDKVADVVEPVMGATRDLQDEIHNKKTLVVKEKKTSIIDALLGK